MLDIDEAAKRLKLGGIVAIPTETVYGLAADATKLLAIQEIFTLKKRPLDNPLIVHIGSLEQLGEISKRLMELELSIIKKLWPGPLTLLLPRRTTVLDAVTAGLETVAVRMPNHRLCLDLLQKTGPLVAPSANLSGTPSPTKKEHVLSDFGEDFPVLDGGICSIGLESTVLSCRPSYFMTTGGNKLNYPYKASHNNMIIYRPGAISAEQLSEFGSVKYYTSNQIEQDATSSSKNIPSPGLKYRHYAPKAKIVWLSNIEQLKGTQLNSIVLLLDNLIPDIKDFLEQSTDHGFHLVYCEGTWERFGQLLYDTFRIADLENYTHIFVQDIRRHPFSNDLKEALINRIEKAISGH